MVIDEAAQGKAAMGKHLKQQQANHGSAVKEKLAERKAKAELLAATQEAHGKELEEHHAAGAVVPVLLVVALATARHQKFQVHGCWR